MARYTGPVCRLCRRENVKLFLKGDRCYTDKCAVNRRSALPGAKQHHSARRKISEYGMQLREKQKARRIYGVLEGQFHHYYEEAERRKGVSGENLLRLLEIRLDNVVFRAGLANSRAQARQLVRHGHFAVNGVKTNIPSFQVRVGQVITVRERSRSMDHFKNVREVDSGRIVPKWLDVDAENLQVTVAALPVRDDIDYVIEEQYIIELYSK